MTDRGAMPDEMGNRPDLEGAAFASHVRELFATQPSDEVARAHLAAITAAVRETPNRSAPAPERLTPPRRPALSVRALRWVASGIGVGVAASAMAAGLSFAGVVTLPQPARHLFGKIGITLPGEAVRPSPVSETPPAAEATPTHPNESDHPTPQPHPSPQHGRPSSPPDEADARAAEGADNADARASLGADNADQQPSEAGGDNADDRAGGDNADPRGVGGDTAP